MKPTTVKVYRSLRHGRKAPALYSVIKNGRVVKRVHRILLSGAKFVVSEAGRKRVLREKRKNVHAFVVGYEVDSKGTFGTDKNGKDLPVKVSYNPYLRGHFMAYGLTFAPFPVKGARAVLLNEHGISACYLE
jgi:hypothetical protein